MATKIIRILTSIGEEQWEYSALVCAEQLDGLTANDKLVVEIASNGGSVIEGEKIFTLLRHAPCKVEIKAIGLVASIATLIYLASPNRTALSNARFMIHSPWLNAGNVNSKQASKIAENLQGEETRLKGFYAQAGIDVNSERFTQLFENEIFFTATEARKMGFVKNIIYKQPVLNMNPLVKQARALQNSMINFVNKVAGLKAELVTVTTTDGVELIIDCAGAMPAIGDICTYADGTPVEVGGYMLADGSVINIDETSTIVSITPDEIEPEMDGMEDPSMEDLKKENAAMKQEMAALKSGMKECEAAVAEITKMHSEAVAKVKALAKVAPISNGVKPNANIHAQKAKEQLAGQKKSSLGDMLVATKGNIDNIR